MCSPSSSNIWIPSSAINVTLVPVAPTRFRGLGGPNGYIYMEVDVNGDKVESLTAELDDTLALVYEPES